MSTHIIRNPNMHYLIFSFDANTNRNQKSKIRNQTKGENRRKRYT